MTGEAQILDIQRYWDRRPCNIGHGTEPVGSGAWSRQVTERKYFIEPHIPGFAQFARWAGRRVLEIGCGIGTDTLEFARAGAHVDAVDLSMASLQLARKRLGLAGVSVIFHHADAEVWLPRHAVDYDLIYSFGVLHHTPHPEKVLRLAHSRLKSDGELRIMLYARWSLKNLLDEQSEAQAGCPLVRRYTERSARRLLEDCGFMIESVQKAHIFPWRVKDYVQHRYVKRWCYRLLPSRAFRALERLLGDHLLIVARKESRCAR